MELTQDDEDLFQGAGIDQWAHCRSLEGARFIDSHVFDYAQGQASGKFLIITRGQDPLTLDGLYGAIQVLQSSRVALEFTRPNRHPTGFALLEDDIDGASGISDQEHLGTVALHQTDLPDDAAGRDHGHTRRHAGHVVEGQLQLQHPKEGTIASRHHPSRQKAEVLAAIGQIQQALEARVCGF